MSRRMSIISFPGSAFSEQEQGGTAYNYKQNPGTFPRTGEPTHGAGQQHDSSQLQQGQQFVTNARDRANELIDKLQMATQHMATALGRGDHKELANIANKIQQSMGEFENISKQLGVNESNTIKKYLKPINEILACAGSDKLKSMWFPLEQLNRNFKAIKKVVD